MLLEALETAPLAAAQADLAGDVEAAELDRLVDQLAQRLGTARVVRLQPVDSHIPERAQALVPAGAALQPRPWLARQPRPLRLLHDPSRSRPWPACPTGHPLWLRRRRERQRVVAAAGPERILPEWWRPGDGPPARATTTASPPPTAPPSGSAATAITATPGRPEWRVRGGFA